MTATLTAVAADTLFAVVRSSCNVDRIRRCIEVGPMVKVENMLLALYDCQTADEQDAAETHESNGVGFNSTDANFLSSLAEQVRSHRSGYSRYPSALSANQERALRKALRKYSGQLARIAEGGN
jgi:hypothetical protein